MIKKTNKTDKIDKCFELLQNLLILELGKEGIPQQKIRSIVGVDMSRVSKIVKNLKK